MGLREGLFDDDKEVDRFDRNDDEESESSDDSSSSDSGDGSNVVVVPESPAEREKLKDQGESVAVGSGDTSEEAQREAAQNPDFDADEGTEVDKVEDELGTDQPLANPEGENPEEVQQALEKTAKNKRGSRIGRKAGAAAQAIEEAQRKEKARILEEKDSFSITSTQQNNSKSSQSFSPEPLSQSEAENFIQNAGFTNPGLRSTSGEPLLSAGEQVRLSTPTGKTQTTNDFRPDTFLEEVQAKDEFISAKGERSPGFVIEETVNDLTGTEGLGNVVGFLPNAASDTVEGLRNLPSTARSAVNNPAEFQQQLTTPSLQRDGLQFDPSDEADFQQKASDISLITSAATGPLSSTARGTQGLASVSGVTRKGIPDKVIEGAGSKAKTAAAKADPATGIGRTRRPGETTPTTPEIIRDKASSTKDFLKGDIRPETRRRPEAREINIETENPGVRFENQEATETINIDATKLNPERDDLSIDPQGNIPIEEFERNRVEAFEDFIGAERGDLPFPGRTSKGQLKLETKTKTEDKTPDLDNSDFVRRIDDQDRRQDVSSDSIEDRLLRDRDRDRRRIDRREFNKPEQDTGISNALGLSQASNQFQQSSNGLDLGQDQGETPFQDQDQNIIQDQRQRQDQDQTAIGTGGDGNDLNRIFKEDDDDEVFRRDDSDNILRDSDSDIGRGKEESSERSKQEEAILGDNKNTKFEASVGAELIGLKADEVPENFQDPTNLRPIVENT